MSKDQKKNVNIPVENVEKWYKSLEWVCATLEFWKLDDKWPTNLIKDVIYDIFEDVVSVSHINDK